MVAQKGVLCAMESMLVFLPAFFYHLLFCCSLLYERFFHKHQLSQLLLRCMNASATSTMPCSRTWRSDHLLDILGHLS